MAQNFNSLYNIFYRLHGKHVMYISVEHGRTSGTQKGAFCIFSRKNRAASSAFAIGLIDGGAIFRSLVRERDVCLCYKELSYEATINSLLCTFLVHFYSIDRKANNLAKDTFCRS